MSSHMLGPHIYTDAFLYVFSGGEPDYWNHQRFFHILDIHNSEAFHQYVRVSELEEQSATNG